LKAGVTLAEFEQAIQDTRAEKLLNWVDVFAGDMLYVAAGTVHTIGGGMVLVETQQTSDITYRLYDYGRPRALHIEEGLAATKLHTNAGKVVRSTALQRRVNAGENLLEPASASANVLVRSPFFQVEKMQLREPLHSKVTRDSPHILVAVSGAGIVESQGMEPINFVTGDAVVVPACVCEYLVRPQWELEVMRMSLPTGAVAEPQTNLPQSIGAK
jgi:mannose-6-phosphate isomerase